MVLLIILWVLFFFSHSLLAANAVKHAAEKVMGSFYRFYRILYNLLSLVFLTAVLYLLYAEQSVDLLFAVSSTLRTIAYVLMVAGLIIMLMAFSNYDLAEFAGISQLAKQLHHPDKLVIKGINRYVRNPLYTGIVVFIAGWFILQPNYEYLLSMVIIYIYIYIGATLEERKLEEVFGDEYREYKTKVRMLIPFIF
jgi:protein-S-isoprenylcysteine O-methyltransferase Ste14